MNISKATQLFSLLALFFISCQPHPKNNQSQKTNSETLYASRFSIESKPNYKIISIDKPWQGSTNGLKYVLYQGEQPQLSSVENYTFVKTPVASIVATSTTHIGFLELLNATDQLTGFAQCSYIYSPTLQAKVAAGKIKEMGHEGHLDVETVVAHKPDIVMAYRSGNENKQLDKLQSMGMKIILNADYLEESVLGRAEWIKFMACFVGQEARADSLFNAMLDNYDSLTKMVKNSPRPSVFSGSLYGGSWYAPGGENYGAQILADAGANYLWQDNDQTGWLKLDFEAVYASAMNADCWIGVSNFKSLDDLAASDERYKLFKAFRTGQVYTYTNRVSQLGGNDYFESANAKPHLLLADIIKIIHPELLPDYQLYYYKLLN